MKSIHEWRVERLFEDMGQMAVSTPPHPRTAPLAQQPQPAADAQGGQPATSQPNQQQQPPQPDSDEDMKRFVSQVGRHKAKVMMDTLQNQTQGSLTPKKKAAVIALMLHGMGVSDPSELLPIFRLIKQYAQEGLLGQNAVSDQQNQQN